MTGCTTIVGPNKPSCTDPGNDDRDGIFDPTSFHTGGAQCLMGDGAVRFISENINTGNLTADLQSEAKPAPTASGVRLGSVSGGEVVGEF